MDNIFNNLRAKFIEFLVSKDMYVTLSVMAQCRIVTVDDLDAAASISVRTPSVISFHTGTLEKLTQDEFNTLMLHELYHFPQLMYAHELWKSVAYPADVTEEPLQKVLTFAVLNRAMDITIHEQIAQLISEDVLKQNINSALAKFDEATSRPTNGPVSGCFAKDDMEKNKDAAYYVSYLLKDCGGDPDKLESSEGPDGHDFGELGPGTAAEIRKMLEDATAAGKAMANGIGRKASDTELVLGQDPLQSKIRNALARLKTSVNRVAQGRSSTKYNWAHNNKFWPGLPGRSMFVEKSKGVFFVADTSGSMCEPAVLNQMIPAVDELARRHLIVKAYACDSELTKFGKVVKGGGGTELSARHVDQIRKEHNLSDTDKIDIIYLTDGEVWGLDQIEKDPFTKLHLVLV